jgi:hypothetical protein
VSVGEVFRVMTQVDHVLTQADHVFVNQDLLIVEATEVLGCRSYVIKVNPLHYCKPRCTLDSFLPSAA